MSGLVVFRSAPTWTPRASAVDNDWYSVCWSPERGLFCAVAYTGVGNRVMTSDVVRLEVTDFQETAPIKVGETARAFAGGARSSVRAEKRTFTATTPPIGKTEYDALLADCALEADVVVTGNCLLGASLTCKVRPTYKLVGVGTAVAGYNFTYAVTLAIEEA